VTDEQLRLAAEFPAVTVDQWEEAAASSLRGRSLDSLRSEDLDGIRSDFIYFASVGSTEPTAENFARGSHTPARRHFVRSLGDIEDALEADVEAIIAEPALVAERGLTGLPDVFLPTGSCTVEEIQVHMSHLAERPERFAGGLGIDPLGMHLKDSPVDLGQVPELVTRALDACPGLTAISVSSAAFHLGGASDAQELGTLLASSVSYLRQLESRGIAPDTAASQMEWSLQLGANFFRSVTKLRSARRLVDSLFAACGAQTRVGIHATTAERSFTLYESSVNFLRSTSAVSAALVGGADSVSVLLSDLRRAGQDTIAARMALNIPEVLLEEAHLGRVSDPAGGSWYFENHRELLIQKSWEFFQSIESQGGLEAVLANGWIQNEIAETAAARRALIADRALPITGVSEFPLLHGDFLVQTAAPDISGLGVHYLDEDFAALRLSAEKQADSGQPLVVSVVCVGRQAEYAQRLSWVSNLLAAGGFRSDVVQVGSLSSGSTVILCGSDADYLSSGAELVGDIRRSGASHVAAVGKSTLLGELALDETISAESNAVAFLEGLHERLVVDV
jgi:methylmalonyl-CoA mutase